MAKTYEPPDLTKLAEKLGEIWASKTKLLANQQKAAEAAATDNGAMILQRLKASGSPVAPYIGDLIAHLEREKTASRRRVLRDNESATKPPAVGEQDFVTLLRKSKNPAAAYLADMLTKGTTH